MAKPARSQDTVELPIAGPITTTITYLPVEGDPVTVKWCGVTFHANVPVELTGNPEGTKREQLNAWMIESAKGNKYYAVGDAPRPRATKPAQPTTPEEYRAYMVDWLRGRFEHVDDLIARFAKDRELQVMCEVGTDDFAYLGSLFLPKLHDLAKADEMTEGQVASAWLRHGVNQLPF